ncbi:glycosyltransferase [candidate division KSB1 bacterium]|nr:glycosyltransferase [candidate division KSB1 bacterium]RQW01083.1 MAG: glycosyltransferase [candidate division KSB1 bacterium]
MAKNTNQTNDSLVSIGMPVYNGQRFLRKAIESLLHQTFENFELIISDNASTDATPEICQDYARHDRRIRFIRNTTNLGAAKNYNRVFELSSGMYFKWAAADDCCAPNFLARCVAVLEKETNVILAYPKTKIIDENDEEIAEYDDGIHLKSLSAAGRFLQFMYCVGECNAVFGLLRSDGLKKTRLIGNYIGADVCLLAELSLLGRFYEIPDYLFFRRHHSEASSAKKDVQSQLLFYDPAKNKRFVLPKWRHFFEHYKSIKRVDIPATQKILPALYIFGSLIVDNKTYRRELAGALKRVLRSGTSHKKIYHIQRGVL